MPSLFNELKRRNVIRVGVAYMVAAWVLLQIGDVLIGMLELPGWIGKALVLVMALAFPIVLIFAWAFELTPEGLKADADVDRSAATVSNAAARKLDLATIGLVLLALAVVAADRLVFSERSTSPGIAATGIEVPVDASVAVLPFQNISQDAANEPFTIGIHDDLLTQISKVGSLKTISRTSVLPYKNTTKPLAQIAAELGVATILEGGVQRAGDRVRVNVQLIDAQTNSQLWGERYERRLTAANIFELQSEIVKAIADALQATLSLDEQQSIEKVPTENLAALEFYFLGRERLESRNTGAITEAIRYYQQAIDLDPEFALAYVGLADSYQLLEDAGSLSREEMFTKAGAALEKALMLDSELGAAYTTMGGIHWTAGDYPAAEASFLKSIALSPNYARAYLWYGLLLVDWGRIDAAVKIYEEGIEHDPLSSQLIESLGYAHELRGQFDAALEDYQKSAAVNSTFSTSFMASGNIHWMARGRLSEAVACQKKSIDRDPGARLPRVYLGLLYLDMGDDRQAEPWIGSAARLAPDSLEPMAALALLDLYRGKYAESARNAARAQTINPYFAESRLLQTMALAVLRNYDLQNGSLDDARARYAKSYGTLLDNSEPVIDLRNYRSAIDLALVLQKTGEDERATALLDRSLAFLDAGTKPRLGIAGYGIADVQIHAMRGEKARALAALRKAIDQGWRGFWWFYLKNNPNLASLQDSAEFQAMVREIESVMVAQRATIDANDTCGTA